MASPYESYKVRELVTAYRSNPTMFTDDQLDQLEQLAEQNNISFKRQQSEFNLNRAVRQAQAGFVEGMTTFDLIPEEPRNTGEAIFRQLGHLAGFAPGILKAPVVGMAKLAAKATGKETKDALQGRFTQAALRHIDVLDSVSAPMVASRFTKRAFDKTLQKTGLESFDFLKKGSRTRAISEEALGLASASAVSNIWKGKDAIVDGYIGGAIAGGAFGGIGNFVSVGNLYKGTPQQVETANKTLRAGVASLFMGLPSTLRNDPTEMQIYEYLLGGFFGYNTRPARENEAAKWFNKNRKSEEIFRPENSKEWSDLSKGAQEYIMTGHPVPKEINKEVGGSVGSALNYLKFKFPDINHRESAIRQFQKNGVEFTETDIHNYYRNEASKTHKAESKIIENIVTYANSFKNDERVDFVDDYATSKVEIKNVADRISRSSKDIGTPREVQESLINISDKSIKDGVPNVESFLKNVEVAFNKEITAKEAGNLRKWYHQTSQNMLPMDLVTLNIDGKNYQYRTLTKDKINNVSIGIKGTRLPANDLVPESEFKIMTHVVKEQLVRDKNEQVPTKIMEQKLNQDNQIEYALKEKDLQNLQYSLEDNGRYIVSGVKDKDYILTSRFRDEGITLDNIFDALTDKGNLGSRKDIEQSYNRSLAREKQIFGNSQRTEQLHERKWISNVVNATQMNNLRWQDAYVLQTKDANYGKSVAELNKRMSLVTNRMTNMVKESFETIGGMNGGRKLNTIIVEDVGLKSDTDGVIVFRNDVLDAATTSMGLNPKVTGHLKPVIASKTDLGFLATKSNGQEGFPLENAFMKANNIHAIIYKSAAKLSGQNKTSDFIYENGKYNSKELNIIEVPIDKLQVSSGTYENTAKDVMGALIPMQFAGQINNVQAPEYTQKYVETIIKPSLLGSKRSQDMIAEFNKTQDVKAFAEAYSKQKMRLEELPFDFVMEKLLKEPDSKIGRLLSDSLLRLDLEGNLNKTAIESFEFDSDPAFRDFHQSNKMLAEALRNTFVAKHTMNFNQSNYFNALRKYAVKRFSNPHIETGGKSWLKGFRDEYMNFVDIDPAKKTKKLKEGELYLDEGFRKMPVVLFGKRYTLGEIWSMYTGKKPMPTGVKKPTQKEWDEAFTMLTIRTPADSISGTRALRFKGFTGQKGAGSFTHHKDNTYLGGADKDADSIKIFQGIDKSLIKHYKKNKNERDHWYNKDGSRTEYHEFLNGLFKGKESEQTVNDFMNNPYMVFSPSFRFDVAKNSSTGKEGLGYGLSAKISMQNMYDYIKAKGGKVILNGVEISLKKDSPFKGVDAHQFFRDLGTKIVNVSADASKDPNLRPYNQFRDMLFNSLFVAKEGKNNIVNYGTFMKSMKGTSIEAIDLATKNIKPHYRIYGEDGSRAATIFQVLNNTNRINNSFRQRNLEDTVPVELNRLMFENGFVKDNYTFDSLRVAHANIAKEVLTSGGLFVKSGKATEIRNNNKLAKELESFYKILAKEMSLATAKNIETNIRSNPEQALDFIGKDLGQYALIELLTNQYVNVQSQFAKQGRNVNTLSKLIPDIKDSAYKVKEIARQNKSEDNVRVMEVDAAIRETQQKLSNIELRQKLPDRILQDYFHYWLLSPLRPVYKKLNVNYDKVIHASSAIPMSAKRKYYNQIDKIYDRYKDASPKDRVQLDIKQADLRKDIKESPLLKEVKTEKSINDIIQSRELERLAFDHADVKEIRKFQDNLKKFKIVDRDFNEWYTSFTLQLSKNAGIGVPRDVSTLKMEDIQLVNRYFRDLSSNKNMELTLADYYRSPLTVDEQLSAKGLIAGYHKVLNAPVKTSQGIVYKDVKVYTSPIGNIANYFKKAEAAKDQAQNTKNLDTKKLDSLIQPLSNKERQLYMDNLFSFREGKDANGKPFTKDNIDPKINLKLFNKINNELTAFWPKMEAKWLSTKDVHGNKYNWDKIDVDKEYGKVNEYIRYDKNGKLDFKLFHNKVLNGDLLNKNIIKKVGLEGVLRYKHEEFIEKSLRNTKPKNPKAFREKMRESIDFKGFKARNYEKYMHHSFSNATEGLLIKQAEYIAKQPKGVRETLSRMMQSRNEFIRTEDVLDIDPHSKSRIEENLKIDRLTEGVLEAQGEMPYKRSYDFLQDYQSSVIEGYYKNLMKIKAQNEIDLMMKVSDSYKKRSNYNKEAAQFKDMYKGISESAIPKELRYENYLDVWADYIRLYARDSLGHQSFLSSRMETEQGRKLLHLNKKNLWYGTSDQAIINKMEKLYKSKLGSKENIPFFNKKAIPKDPEARKEYFSRVIHNLGRAEAQYELLTLLANTGTWSTNIFGGATMTMGSAGVKNYSNSFNNKRVYDVLLTDSKGKEVLKLLNGTPVKNRKELMTYLEERGVIDNFIKNEFEFNEPLKSGLKKKGVNLRDFQRDIIKAAKSKKGNRDESVLDVAKRYGVKDTMLKYGGFLMKQSERVNRLNAFIAHGMQAVESFGKAGRDLSLADQYVFNRAERGIEMTQFLYQNAYRPAFMRTSMGKVLGRFKLFVFNSIRMRKEFYRQAKLAGFKEGTESYNRFKDTFAIDMLMYALGSAFMFSLFDTTLPPPYDWVQALSDYTFGTKREKDMAFFGSKLGPLNVLKPPIARIPEAFGELLTGQYEDFTNYTMYTMLPFGRGIRQIKQLTDDRPKRGLERAPEILFRIPYHQMKSRIDRVSTENKRRQYAAEIL